MNNWITIFMLLSLMFLAGCTISFTPFQSKPAILPEANNMPTPQQIVYRTLLKTDWLITLSLIGMAIGVYAFVQGGKNSLPAIIACFALLVSSLAVKAFGWYFAIGGTIGMVLLAVYYVFIKEKALKEIIKSVQNYKNELNGEARKDVNIALINAQSETTQNIVKQIKEKL